jgi:hypothetical protein
MRERKMRQDISYQRTGCGTPPHLSHFCRSPRAKLGLNVHNTVERCATLICAKTRLVTKLPQESIQNCNGCGATEPSRTRETQGARLDRLDHILVLSQPSAHLTGKEYEGAIHFPMRQTDAHGAGASVAIYTLHDASEAEALAILFRTRTSQLRREAFQGKAVADPAFIGRLLRSLVHVGRPNDEASWSVDHHQLNEVARQINLAELAAVVKTIPLESWPDPVDRSRVDFLIQHPGPIP